MGKLKYVRKQSMMKTYLSGYARYT